MNSLCILSICGLVLAFVFSQGVDGQPVDNGLSQNYFKHQRFIPLFANEKRAEQDFMNDPRMFSTAFGKRSAASFDDPRLFSTAFGR